MVNGIDELAVTNLDGLDQVETIRVCTHYKLGRKKLEVPPTDHLQLAECEPVYIEMPGWMSSTEEAREFDDLPEKARDYLGKIAELTGAALRIASVGPGRDQTIVG